MQFTPEQQEEIRIKTGEAPTAMQADATTDAERDLQIRAVDARKPMMDDQLFPLVVPETAEELFIAASAIITGAA